MFAILAAMCTFIFLIFCVKKIMRFFWRLFGIFGIFYQNIQKRLELVAFENSFIKSKLGLCSTLDEKGRRKG